MSRQAVTQHLACSSRPASSTTIWHGREKLHYLNPVPLHEIADRWIGKFERSRLRAFSDFRSGWKESRMSKPQFVYVIYIKAAPEKSGTACSIPR